MPVVIKKYKRKQNEVKHPCGKTFGTVYKHKNGYFFCDKCSRFISEELIRYAYEQIGESYQEPPFAPEPKEKK